MPRQPHTFRRFVGFKKQVDLLRRQLVGAKSRAEPFPPTLFAGPSGVGKTLLAESLAEEYGAQLHAASGHESLVDLSGRIASMNACDFLFLDEAQRLDTKSQELLYGVIDRQQLPRWDSTLSHAAEGPFVKVSPCTVILATDQPGKLLNALNKRMELTIRLGYYNNREMRLIVDRLAADLDLLISPQAANRIAMTSAGIPRKAKHALRNLRRYLVGSAEGQITLAQVREFLKSFGIDEKGLDRTERQYLRMMNDTRPTSIESIALGLGMDADYVRRQIEPVLKRVGLIQIGAGGRRLTLAGQEHLKSKSTK